jgi:crotonobetainyl-CoA:carnitine CoA-transferase CaiB-like acyl-CoA transferase
MQSGTSATDEMPAAAGYDVLAGLRVLDFSNGVPGAQVSQYLADYGADVLAVEPPGGSRLRERPGWPLWGRGKGSVELDLRSPAGRAAARDLAGRADVVIETFRPGVADRLGIGPDELGAINPRLVYASITGFGRHGPLADLAGYEAVVHAKLGLLSNITEMSRRPGPSFATIPSASFPATHLCLQGILAALYERESSGRGQRVETTLVQGMSVHDTFNWFSRVIAQRFPGGFGQTPLSVNGIPSGGLSFRLLIALTKDGHWVQFSQTVQRLFVAMMRMFELDWMFDDPKWKSAPDFDDLDVRVEFWEIMLAKVRSKTLAEWRALMDVDTDVWAEQFTKGNQALDHAQVRWNGQAVVIDDPDLGLVGQPGPPVQLIGPPPRRIEPAPRRGEHRSLVTDEPDLRVPVATDQPNAGDSAGAPLAGVTVVELGTYYAAPYGATLLADLGARVIKLEQTDGDPHRHMLPFPEAAGMKVLQGKESVAVDVSTEEGRRIAYDVIAHSDIVLQSFRAGVAERLRLDPESLRSVNPDLIYLSAPGYGVGGPNGHRPAFAPTIGAAGGVAWRNAGSTIPDGADLTEDQVKNAAIALAYAVMGAGNSDGFSGVNVGTALLLGLLARRRGAGGLEMRTNMLAATLHALSEDMVRYADRAPAVSADADLFGFGPLYRMYPAATGWLLLAAPSERDWERLVAGLSAEIDLAADARFRDPSGREAHAAALADELARLFASRPAADWEQRLRAAGVAGVEVAPGPIEANYMDPGSVGDLCDLVTEAEQPILELAPRLRPLTTFSRSSTVARGACRLGDHTAVVLAELGYDAEQVADWSARGIVVIP